MIYKKLLKSRLLKVIICISVTLHLSWVYQPLFRDQRQDAQVEEDANNEQNSPESLHRPAVIRNSGLMRKIPPGQRIRASNVFAIPLCRDLNKRPDDEFSEKPTLVQLDYAHMLIKSAVAMTTQTLRFVIYVDSLDLFDDLNARVNKSIPEGFRQRLILEQELSWDVKDVSNARPCELEPFFIPNNTQYDSVIALDADSLFFRAPEDLWAEFRNFTEEQMIGMVPKIYRYVTYADENPVTEENGPNGAVILMNITRLQSFPGDWTTTIQQGIERQKEAEVFGGQDLINNLYNETARILHYINCGWNYYPSFCRQLSNECYRSITDGISLLRGPRTPLNRLQMMKVKVIYDAWKNYAFDIAMPKFWTDVESQIKAVDSLPGLVAACPGIQNLNRILLNGVKRLQ